MRSGGAPRGPTGLRAAGLVTGLLLVATAAFAQPAEVVARAAGVSGRAFLTGSGGAMVPLTPGYVLNPGDRIDTRGGGRVVIDLSDGSMVIVQPESVILLKDFRQASSLRELFDIAVGLVRVKINHFGGRPNPYHMNSPTASIAVRGTEFSIEVSPRGDTSVVVYEGAVEVTSLADPARRILIEAGRGVLVRAGQDFLFLSPGNRLGDIGDRDAGGDPRPPQLAAAPPPGQERDDHPSPHADHDEPSPRATASTYDRFVAGLADIAQMPFLLRYNAFAEPHLDSLENPAVATTFTGGEARFLFLPSIHRSGAGSEYAAAFGADGAAPADYTVSPQVSMFLPVGGGFVAGGYAAASRLGSFASSSMPDPDTSTVNEHALNTQGRSSSDFYSGALLLARRFGRNSAGFEVEHTRGSGGLVSTTTDFDPGYLSQEQVHSASRVSETRLTAGLSRDLSNQASLGLFYRYGFLSATDADRSHTIDGFPLGLNSTVTAGHSSEFGMRLRGAINDRLLYGFTAALADVSLADGLVRSNSADSHARDQARRGSVAIGLGYAVSRRVILTLDVAGGANRTQSSRAENATGSLLQYGATAGHFVSAHGAVQADLTRRLFVSASLLYVGRSQNLQVSLFPDSSGYTSFVADPFFPLVPGAYPLGSRFSDFGAGWRFSPQVFLQYVYSTDYGVTPAAHTLMLSYTFGVGRE
jgi:hypothetical protein